MPRSHIKLSIIISDDHIIVRSGIQHIVQSTYPKTDFLLCGTGEEVLKAVANYQFDLAFLDLSMPGKDGIALLRAVKAQCPRLPVIVLSVPSESVFTDRAFKAGASAFVEKGITRDELLHAIEVVLSGRRYLCPHQYDYGTKSGSKTNGIGSLSPKEHSIFTKLALGLSLKEIAAEMEISPKTVTTYRTRILEKLGLDSNAAIAKFAIRHGFLE